MTLILVFATLGFSVSRHYCMGILVEESFYLIDNPGCGLMEDDHCQDSQDHLSLGCCGHEELVISGIDVLNFEEEENQTSFGEHMVTFDHFYLESVAMTKVSQLVLTATDSSPPPGFLCGKQLLILVQRFLI